MQIGNETPDFNLILNKEPFWKQIKKISFMPEKESKTTDTPQDTNLPDIEKPL